MTAGRSVRSRVGVDGEQRVVTIESFGSRFIEPVLGVVAQPSGFKFMAELALVATLLFAYRKIRLVSRTDLIVAFQNVANVIRFETWLGLPFEDNLQRWLIEHPPIIKSLNLYYVYMHFPAAIAVMAWLFIFHPTNYPRIRNLMAVVTFAALVIHLLYPLAPPRMMADFVDTMAVFGPNIYPPNALEGAANQIAAMPSLHFGWAAIEAIAVIWVFNSRWRWLAVVHPLLMALAIVGTANHWWLDGAIAGMLIIATLVGGHLLRRLSDGRSILPRVGRSSTMEAIEDRRPATEPVGSPR